MKLNMYKSMEQDDMCAKVPNELTDVEAKLPFIMFEKLHLSGEVPRD